MTGYELSRQWFDWCYENPDIINPNHAALYFFIIEHKNRMGNPEKFRLPREMAKAAIGIKNNRTYTKTFEDLVKWDFIKVYQRSKNQWSANIIGVVKNTSAHTSALSKATHKHSHKQRTSTVPITKQENKDKPITNKLSELELKIQEFKEFRIKLKKPIKDISEKLWREKLNKLSGGNESVAIEILNESIANGYQGIFELKPSKNGKPQPPFDVAEAYRVLYDNQLKELLTKPNPTPNEKLLIEYHNKNYATRTPVSN